MHFPYTYAYTDFFVLKNYVVHSWKKCEKKMDSIELKRMFIATVQKNMTFNKKSLIL